MNAILDGEVAPYLGLQTAVAAGSGDVFAVERLEARALAKLVGGFDPQPGAAGVGKLFAISERSS